MSIETIMERAKDMTGLGGHAQLVMPRDNGRWEVRPRGAETATELFDNKNEAVQRATELAKKQNAQMVIFKRDGEVERKADYSN